MDTAWRWMLAGAAAAALALGAGELAGALVGGASPIAAVGALVIELQPPGAKDLMVQLFGDLDKPVLELGTAVGSLLVGGLIGALARVSVALAQLGFAGLGLALGMLLVRDPLAGPLAALIVAGAGVVVAVAALPLLVPLRPADSRSIPADTAMGAAVGRPVERRQLLLVTGGAFAVGALVALIGRGLSLRVPEVTAPMALPRPAEPLPPLPPAAELAIEGVAPIIVPAGEFYRIDTNLTVPRIDPETWRLRIHGMVEREVVLTYDDVLAMPLIERYVTLACVSNQVGGYLVGNAAWTGTLLRPLLDRAGVQAGATQIVGRSFDGWTAGFPTAHLDGEGAESLLAVGMNGEPLPAQHGFPARLVVPGLYGYVSATKWITEIELTTLESFDAYWVPLGWAKEAPVLTQSRVDVPRGGARVAQGRVEVAGVAWAPARGVAQVEVQLDDGDWQSAELSLPLSDAAWVQWRASLDVSSGAHSVRVRATDGTGQLQELRRTPPAPDGARGYHEVTFTAA
ncbi:MAG TPA: molybdopterin-dependent oxidoreductase [Candidatus Limnocylindrales bacterium]|nr:molybdopterin-dependent oxidoreductase [Candidatus Limnocylindrales bacterium]